MLAIQGDPSRKWNQHWGVALEYTSKAGRIDAERMGRYLEQSLNPRVTFIEPGPLHQGDFVEFVVDPQWKLGAGLPVFMTARPVNSEWTGRVFGGVRCGLVAPARIDPQHFVRGQIALPDAPGVHHLELEVVMRIGRDIEQSELHGRTSEDDQAEAELWRALPERTVTRRVRVKLDLAASATPRVKMSPNGVDAGTIAQGIGKPWVRCDATVQPPRVAIRFFPQKMAMPMSARVSVRQSGREQDIGWMLASPHFQRSLAVEGDALGIDVHQPFEVVLQSDAGPLERPYWFTTVWEGEVLFPIERPVHAALPGEFARESVKVIP
jgi:hypothetical protein